MNTKKYICSNCSKLGHISKFCRYNSPITSYGLISFKISNVINLKNYLNEETINIINYNSDNLHNLKYIENYYKNAKILMIRRKHSINYVDFIRGKWINNIESIKKIFKLISRPELENIKTNDFNLLWVNLWKKNSWNKFYELEYLEAREKFNLLKKNNFYNLLDNITEDEYQWSEPEWEIPKGRKNKNESDIDCAIREFCEETNINKKNIFIYEKINPISEEYKGTNNKNYKTVYYLANLENVNIDTIEIESNEVSKIEWFSIDKVLNKIRPYYNEKIKLIHQIYFFFINLIKNQEKEQNQELVL